MSKFFFKASTEADNPDTPAPIMWILGLIFISYRKTLIELEFFQKNVILFFF